MGEKKAEDVARNTQSSSQYWSRFTCHARAGMIRRGEIDADQGRGQAGILVFEGQGLDLVVKHHRFVGTVRGKRGSGGRDEPAAGEAARDDAQNQA
jgi:hypothetical protein